MTTTKNNETTAYVVVYRNESNAPYSTNIAFAVDVADVYARYEGKGYEIADVSKAMDWELEEMRCPRVTCEHIEPKAEKCGPTEPSKTGTVTVKNDLVWQFENDSCRELLKAITGVDCVPCEGGVGVASTATLDYYEEYSGKGRTVVYEWEDDFENDTAIVEYAIYDNEVWDQPTPDDRLVEWLDNSPKGYDVWQVVESAAKRVSNDGGTYNVWGEARALAIMSGIHCDDVMRFLGDFADANYHKGERIA